MQGKKQFLDGQYKAEIAGFTYDAPTDAYVCAVGKVLPFGKYDTTPDGNWGCVSNWTKNYGKGLNVRRPLTSTSAGNWEE